MSAMDRRLRREFKRLKRKTCPDDVIRNVYNRVGGELQNRCTEQRLQYLHRLPVRHFLWAAAPACIILIIILFATHSPESMQHHSYDTPYSSSEIAQADQQIKSTLALIHRVSNRTCNRVRNNTLSGYISVPVSRALSLVFTDFSGGNNHE